MIRDTFVLIAAWFIMQNVFIFILFVQFRFDWQRFIFPFQSFAVSVSISSSSSSSSFWATTVRPEFFLLLTIVLSFLFVSNNDCGSWSCAESASWIYRIRGSKKNIDYDGNSNRFLRCEYSIQVNESSWERIPWGYRNDVIATCRTVWIVLIFRKFKLSDFSRIDCLTMLDAIDLRHYSFSRQQITSIEGKEK